MMLRSGDIGRLGSRWHIWSRWRRRWRRPFGGRIRPIVRLRARRLLLSRDSTDLVKFKRRDAVLDGHGLRFVGHIALFRRCVDEVECKSLQIKSHY